MRYDDLYVGWEVNTQCNFYCPHCYTSSSSAKKPEFTLKQCKDFLDELVKLGIKSLALSGGEPFLRLDLLEILQYGKTKGINFSVVTNGTVADEKTLKACAQNNLRSIQVSIDGPDAATNSQIRNCKKEDFSKAVETLRSCRGLGMAAAMGVFLHRKTIDRVGEFVQLAETISVLNIRYASFLPVGRGNSKKIIQDAQPSIAQLKKFLNAVEEINATHPSIKIIPDCATGPLSPEKEYCCIAGKALIYVEADGDVYPCTTLCFEEFKIGNVFEKPLGEVLQNKEKLFPKLTPKENKIGKCRACCNNNCFGGCPGVIYAYFKRTDISPPFCAAYVAAG